MASSGLNYFSTRHFLILTRNVIIAAHEKIIEGTVGMVQLTIDKLEKDGIVVLDEERKAAMVSNLLVVLCSN